MKHKKNLLYIGNKLALHGKPPTAADWFPLLLEKEGYQVVVASEKSYWISRLWDMIWTVYSARKKTDLVLIDTYSTYNFYYATIIAAICRHFKIPYIPILHGGNLPDRLKKNKRISDKLFKGAEVCIAPSMYLLNSFKAHGYTGLIYIPNGIDIAKYPFLPRKNPTPKLLWVRSFAEIYNPLLALEVLEILIKQGLDASLCMVGPDKDGTLGRCKDVAEQLNLPVTFPGLLSKNEWLSLSKEYDVFINTTNFDNMPVSVMEAMALGMPVVSTDVGGMPNLIEHNENGILVAPNHPEAFADAVIGLLDDPKKAYAISRKARASMEKFDWEAVKKLWKATLDAV